MNFDNTLPDVYFPNGFIMGGLMYIQTGPTTYEPWDGSVDVTFTATSLAINNAGDTGTLANVLESTEEPDVFGLVVVNPDGSNIGGGGSGGAVTIANGADVNSGSTTDAAVTGDNTGTLSAKLRGINKILANVWDAVNSRLNVFIQNTTLAVTQSGSWLVAGTIADDATTPGNPITVGGTAKSPDGTDPGNVSAEDDVIRFIGDLNRIVYVNTDDPTKKCLSFTAATAYEDEVVAATPGAGYRLVITRVRFSSGTDTEQRLEIYTSDPSLIAGPYFVAPTKGSGFMFDCYIPVPANKGFQFETYDDGNQTIEFEWITKKV